MAKVVDPDVLALIVDGSASTEEIEIQTDAKTIEVTLVGDVDDDSPGATSGVTKQCVYSFLKEEWKTNTTLNKFKFPLKAIYEAKFIWQYGWQPANQQTRDLFRDAGWQEIDGSEKACLISLGSQYDTTQQAGHQQIEGFDQAITDFDKTGLLNEAVEIVGTGGTPDYTGFLKVFLRVWQRLYADYNLIVEQGFTALTYIAYRLPLANANDTKNTGTTEAYIDTAVDPYQNMQLQYYRGTTFETVADQAYVVDEVVLENNGAGSRWWRCTTGGTLSGTTGVPKASWTLGGSVWEAYPGERLIGAVYFAFNRSVLDGVSGTQPNRDEIYKFCQQRLRKASDINDDGETEVYGTVNGEVAVRLCYYVGDQLHSWPGVHFDDYDPNIKNFITLHDITVDGGGLDSEDVPVTSTERNHPFTAAGNMVFSQNLVDETNADTLYTMYFQYIAIQTAQTDFTISGSSGADAVLNGTGMTLSVGEYFILSGFLTNTENNGVKVATGSPTATVVPYTDALGVNQTDDVLGDAVTLKEQPYDTASAIIVNDATPAAIQGQVTQVNEPFTFDYDGNVQGGRTFGEDAPVVVTAQGLNDSEVVFAEFVITAAAGLSFPVNAPDERTYLNP